MTKTQSSVKVGRTAARVKIAGAVRKSDMEENGMKPKTQAAFHKKFNKTLDAANKGKYCPFCKEKDKNGHHKNCPFPWTTKEQQSWLLSAMVVEDEDLPMEGELFDTLDKTIAMVGSGSDIHTFCVFCGERDQTHTGGCPIPKMTTKQIAWVLPIAIRSGGFPI